METQTQRATWSIDQSHSSIGFNTRHMVVSKVRGTFNDYNAEISLPEDDFTKAQVSFEAQVNSIDTGNEQRDGHLKSDDFFNAEQYPTLKFKSTSISKSGEEEYEMKGDLTIRDVTKPITLTVEFGGIIKDPYGNDRAGFHIHGKVNRFDYNLKWNAFIETGGAVVAENIVIDCDVEITKNKEE